MDRIKRTPVKVDETAALTRVARLGLPPERQALITEVITSTFTLLDTLDQVDLGEVAPAFAYRAKWEKRA